MKIRMTEEMLKKTFENAMTKLSNEEIASVIFFGGDMYNQGIKKGIATYLMGQLLGAAILGGVYMYKNAKVEGTVANYILADVLGVVKNKEEEAQ